MRGFFPVMPAGCYRVSGSAGRRTGGPFTGLLEGPKRPPKLDTMRINDPLVGFQQLTETLLDLPTFAAETSLEAILTP
jgi:hypothetical protein